MVWGREYASRSILEARVDVFFTELAMTSEDVAARDVHGAPILYFGVAEDQGQELAQNCRGPPSVLCKYTIRLLQAIGMRL